MSQKNCNGEAEDLESSDFLQKSFHKVTKRLTSQNFQYPNGIKANLNLGADLVLISGEKRLKMSKFFFSKLN